TYAQQTKLVGVCFGHQILAHALGGHAEKSEKGWGLGLRPVQINGHQTHHSWMSPTLPQGAFYYCHQDQVMRLPEGAERLAGNEFCPNGMFVIRNRVLGLQAHPEFTNDVMQKAIAWLDQSTDLDHLDSAAATLHHATADNPVMAQWIVNFLNQ
ncbi:MAG: glutamine amidotransferase-related protein, partial [Ardenticatenaceae bacterium]